MFCPKCSAPNLENAAKCIRCAAPLAAGPSPKAVQTAGIVKFVIGDIFVIPAILLAVLGTPMQNLMWLGLVVPGLVLYGLAIKDLLKAQSLKKQLGEDLAGDS